MNFVPYLVNIEGDESAGASSSQIPSSVTHSFELERGETLNQEQEYAEEIIHSVQEGMGTGFGEEGYKLEKEW